MLQCFCLFLSYFFASTFAWAAHCSILTLAAADLLYIPASNNWHLKDDIKKTETEKQNRAFITQTEKIYLWENPKSQIKYQS